MFRLRVILWTLAAPLALRGGIARAFDWYRPRSAGSVHDAPERIVEAADKILLYRIRGRLVFRTRCLKRTLVLYRLLRESGHPAVAHIGLGRGEHGFDGHAWLTLHGRRIEDPTFTPQRDFTPFLEIDETSKELRGA
ncbi:MAG: lasso peptide biosynthesis B2 protein [Candidatus Hydrogenedentota bacterium]